ncbi:hypothetical protein F4805DRAFT_436078 [Annulohypoxylon moriforme]|nr:hypothetical protein F4805DRAFT_436078 [Annulohypoxylon moriforme]
MTEPNDQYLPNEGHALAVDFIGKKLPELHAYFRNPDVQYDKKTMHYVHNPPSELLSVARPVHMAPTPLAQVQDVTKSTTSKLNVVSESNIHKAMSSLDMIFPTAMKKFLANTKTKKIEPASTYDIRNDQTWTVIYQKLQKSIDDDNNTRQSRKFIDRMKEFIADNIPEPVRMANKFAPQSNIVGPVLGAVQIIVDAIKKGIEVHKEASKGFEGLEKISTDVELFLGTFQDDQYVLQQAVDLLASVLLATEYGIKFFTRSSWKRAGKSIFTGKDYEKNLLESLTDITTQSRSLLDQALKTHIVNSENYMVSSKKYEQLTYQTVHRIHENTESLIGYQSMLGFLIDVNNKLVNIIHQDRVSHERETGIYRDSNQGFSPDQLTYMQQFPPPSFQPLTQLEILYINQDTLWSSLDIGDIDTSDMEKIKNKGKQQLSDEDCAQTEQIVHNITFQRWIVSPTSTKLMIHSNFSRLMMETSALSLFCTSLVESFRSQERYRCLVWFCGLHLGYNDESDSDLSDSEDYLDDYLYSEHNEGDGYPPGTSQSVIKRMMRSLIAQLLCDYDFGPRHMMPPDIDPYSINEGYSLSELRQLFFWLIQQLPAGFTLFCLVDGIVFYERMEFKEPMFDVLNDLLELTTSDDVLASVKILVTSPRPTTMAREVFEEMDAIEGDAGELGTSILSMDLLIPSHVDFSNERLTRNLEAL